MPHDVKGQELKVGDKVVLEGEISAIYPGSETCNITIKAKHPRKDGYHDTLTTTAELVQKVD